MNQLLTTFSNVEVDPSIFQSLRKEWALHLQADVTNITFNAQSLFAIQEKATKPANIIIQVATRKLYGKQTGNKASDHAIEMKSSAPRTRLSQHGLKSPPNHAIFSPAASK